MTQSFLFLDPHRILTRPEAIAAFAKLLRDVAAMEFVADSRSTKKPANPTTTQP